MISVVVTGGNNNYGGHFNERLEASIAHNAGLLTDRRVPCEWVFVEWRPEPDRPLTSIRLTQRFGFVRAVVAPPVFHDTICTNPDVKFLEYHAKNVGIRRTSKPFVIVTNADIFWGPELADGLATLDADPNVVYRANRTDVREDVPDYQPATILKPANHLRRHVPIPPRYTNAAGDFIAGHRSIFDRCTGHDESIRHARIHGDARFCWQAHELGMSFEILGDVYHIDHPGSYVRGVTAAHGGEFEYVKNLPYENTPDWGLAECESRQVGDRIEQLVFDADKIGCINAPAFAPAAARQEPSHV